MNTIALNPDGSLAYRERPVVSEPLPYLGFQVVLAPGCTLRSFFQLLERFPDLAKLNPFCESFIANYKTCPDDGCLNDAVGHLELTRTVEMIGYPGSPSMQLFVNLEGRYDKETCDIKPYWLERLLDLPLRLGRLKHCVFGDQVDTFDFETGFTLFELIDTICWQLSFHNLPEQCRIDI
jgi:hypothetical protein